MHNFAKAHLAFCPPDNKRFGRTAKSALMPNLPKALLNSCSVAFSPISSRISSNGHLSKFNCSTKCWWNHATESFPFDTTEPLTGRNPPRNSSTMSFNNVDLPAPFGPTSAILLPLLIFNVNSRNRYRGGVVCNEHCPTTNKEAQQYKQVAQQYKKVGPTGQTPNDLQRRSERTPSKHDQQPSNLRPARGGSRTTRVGWQSTGC